MAAAMGATELVYRYTIVEVWGSQEGRFELGTHLLEREDCGSYRELRIFDFTLGKVTGGVVGEFLDTAEVCPCGKYLTTVEHECEVLGLDGNRAAPASDADGSTAG